MTLHTIRFADTGEEVGCRADVSLLRSLEQLGRCGIPVGCRNGGCGVCKIEVLTGACDRKVMSRAHVSAEEERRGMALACRIFPRSDMNVRVVGKMKGAFSVNLAAARDMQEGE